MEKLIKKIVQSTGVWVIFLVLLAACLSARKWQTTQSIQFHFQPTSAMWNDLLQNSKLTSLIYVPNIITFTGEL
jgi:predicted negative regulator of RcsB-dependent stress response